ncbi:MAG: hypothetical protein ACOZAO_03305 [Patescibacteria group bacterium]
MDYYIRWWAVGEILLATMGIPTLVLVYIALVGFKKGIAEAVEKGAQVAYYAGITFVVAAILFLVGLILNIMFAGISFTVADAALSQLDGRADLVASFARPNVILFTTLMVAVGGAITTGSSMTFVIALKIFKR